MIAESSQDHGAARGYGGSMTTNASRREAPEVIAEHPDISDISDLPLEGAFILDFRADAATAPHEALRGRVEHVPTGLATRFASADELLDFVQRVLHSHVRTNGHED